MTDRDRLTSELSSLCRAELAGYKQPRRFEYCDELPSAQRARYSNVRSLTR
ncbi:putative fatty-acid--CoA ligase domain protein [Mycobacterium xenopi 3993]|nr:putative fatty-acid--CoA ligase domain protein [Mycobacterium xenopi 3993]